MKKLTDKEIQELLEDGITDAKNENTDIEAYRQLFSALAREPAYTLPANFSAGVAARVAAAKNTRLAFKFYLLAALAMLVIFVPVCVLLALSDTYAGVISSVLQYKWALLFGLAVFISVTYFDPKRRYPAEVV